MNKLLLIGNLGRDPERHTTSTGKTVTTFSLAVNRFVTAESGERLQYTDWFNIMAWDHLAQTAFTYLHKGDKVFVEGRVGVRQYRDANHVERAAMDVVIYDLEMLSPKSSSTSTHQPEADEDVPDDEDEEGS